MYFLTGDLRVLWLVYHDEFLFAKEEVTVDSMTNKGSRMRGVIYWWLNGKATVEPPRKVNLALAPAKDTQQINCGFGILAPSLLNCLGSNTTCSGSLGRTNQLLKVSQEPKPDDQRLPVRWMRGRIMTRVKRQMLPHGTTTLDGTWVCSRACSYSNVKALRLGHIQIVAKCSVGTNQLSHITAIIRNTVRWAMSASHSKFLLFSLSYVLSNGI